MESVARDGFGLVCDWSGALRAEHRRQDGSVESRVSERGRLSAADAGARRIVARRDAGNLATAILRERLPVRARPVHLGGRNGVGSNGARTSGAVATVDHISIGFV